MCLGKDDYVQLAVCPHGSFHLRVANTTLHLTREQVLALHAKLSRCMMPDCNPPQPQAQAPGPRWHRQLGNQRN